MTALTDTTRICYRCGKPILSVLDAAVRLAATQGDAPSEFYHREACPDDQRK